METSTVPMAAVAEAVKDTMTVQSGLQGLLVKAAVTPLGRFDAVKVTGVVAPDTSEAVIDDVGLVPPCATEKKLGEGVERLKSKTAAWSLTVCNWWLGWLLMIGLPKTSLADPVAPGVSTTRKVTLNEPEKV